VSRGPGRIERAIRALFDANPDLAFVTDELVEHCYPYAERVSDQPKRVAALEAQARAGRRWECYFDAVKLAGPGVLEFPRKYQVAVLRAAHKVIDGDPDWRAWRIEGQGRGWVFLNHGNVRSYALARLIGDQFNVYRSEKRRRRGGILSSRGYVHDRAELLAQLEGRYQKHIAPDGGWFRFVQQHCAERDGDTERATALREQSDAARAAWSAEFRKRFAAPAVPGNETLTALAERCRALITQNDPDAIRAGLAEIAHALDAMRRMHRHAPEPAPANALDGGQ
jgi:hypothetical protein